MASPWLELELVDVVTAAASVWGSSTSTPARGVRIGFCAEATWIHRTTSPEEYVWSDLKITSPSGPVPDRQRPRSLYWPGAMHRRWRPGDVGHDLADGSVARLDRLGQRLVSTCAVHPGTGRTLTVSSGRLVGKKT